MAERAHEELLFDVSDHAQQAGYQQPSEGKRLAATQPSGRLSSVNSKHPRAHDGNLGAPLASTFPAPLVLPGDELSWNPRYPPQSLRSWFQGKHRNNVTDQRHTIYIASPPDTAESVGHLNVWTQPQVKQKEVRRPPSSDVVAYLQAFYHGLKVKTLEGTPLRFSSWDGCKKAAKSRRDQLAAAVGLETGSESNRIRTRKYDDSYHGQLNLNDLLDVAISILPADAYALLMIVDHDLYEDDEDDFCCGRAYGGSKVAVVSTARYNPALDGKHEIDRAHAWPASHCERYIDGLCKDIGEGEPSKKKLRIRSKQKQARDTATAMHAAVAAHKACPAPVSRSNATDEWLQHLWLGRVCKTASHELGHCLGMDHCTYYACVMQGTAGLAEDARQPPYLCPVDTTKLLRATGADEVRRNEGLLAFCERFSQDALFAAYAAWLRARNRELMAVK